MILLSDILIRKEMDELILVDKDDNEIGNEEKVKCHLGEGILHRAFSVFIFNNKGDLLLQQRGKEKMLWPLYWSNTCCSHPRKGEDYEGAAERRLKEEMGFSCPVKFIGKFQYQVPYKNIGSENELCSVLVGMYTGRVVPNPEEVESWKWIDYKNLLEDVEKNPDMYTPWFKMELEIFNNAFITFLKI